MTPGLSSLFTVQVRQKATHKKTMYYLEQLILKHQAHANTLNIKEVAGKFPYDDQAVDMLLPLFSFLFYYLRFLIIESTVMRAVFHLFTPPCG